MDLSIIEQSPRLRSIYTQLLFCYPISDGVSHTRIVDTLTSGLERLAASFPWLAGQVVNEGASEGKSGTFKIMPFEDLPRLLVRDLTNEDSAPTMVALREAKFPFRMLEEKVICPRMTFAEGPGETASDPAPVLLLQANFITGGLLLAFAASHSTMDIVGQGQIIRLLSNACHHDPFTTEEVTMGNLDRRNLIPLLDDSWKPEPRPVHQVEKTSTSQPTSSGDHSPSPASFAWAYITFKSSSLASLKALATSSLRNSSNFISTDDALCALIWQSVGRARLARLDPTTKSTLTRAVDMRCYLDISPNFTGNMASKTANTSTLQKLADQPLGVIASQLRSTLDPGTLKYNMQANATTQTRTGDIPAAASPVDRTQYVVMSSWSKVDCYDVDFNLGLGRPESVRRPQFSPVEGVVYLLPKAPDGEIAAGLCLRDDDMEKLKEDEELLKYGHFIE